MEPIRKQIADNIRKFRKQNDLTVEEVGKAVNKSGKTVSAWERGQGQPDADELIALCVLFCVNISDFYSRESTLFNEKEEHLFALYRSMNADGRDRLIEQAEIMVKSGMFAKSENHKK